MKAAVLCITLLLLFHDDDAQVAQQGPPSAPKQGNTGDPFEDIFGPITNAVIKPEDAARGAAAAAAVGSWATPTKTPVPAAPARPLLRLHELWKAEAEGGRVLRCGLDGAVTWAEDATKDPVGVHKIWTSSCIDDREVSLAREMTQTSDAPLQCTPHSLMRTTLILP